MCISKCCTFRGWRNKACLVQNNQQSFQTPIYVQNKRETVSFISNSKSIASDGIPPTSHTSPGPKLMSLGMGPAYSLGRSQVHTVPGRHGGKACDDC